MNTFWKKIFARAISLQQNKEEIKKHYQRQNW